MENVGMEELNKKIAKWCGFRGRTTTDPDWYRPQVIAPGGQVIAMPDFTTSLDAYFEYIVPKLFGVEILKLNRYEQEFQTAYKVRVRQPREKWVAAAEKSPSLALCRAVEKLIDGGYGILL